MYEFIKGKLIDLSPMKITLESHGVGYKILIPLNSLSKLPALGSELLLYVSLIVKEDSHTLYGFVEQMERDLFELLITISGIGPKTALALVGHLEISNFQSAILTANVKQLSKVPGIGSKTAERLIIEMKDKLKNLEKRTSSSLEAKPEDRSFSDALNALINLGYNHFQAQKAIKKTLEENKEEKDIGKIITLALRNI